MKEIPNINIQITNKFQELNFQKIKKFIMHLFENLEIDHWRLFDICFLSFGYY